MSSPSKRRDMDVMKLYVNNKLLQYNDILLATR